METLRLIQLSLRLQYKVVLSEKTFDNEENTLLIYIVKRMGPKMKPWGIPFLIGDWSE